MQIPTLSNNLLQEITQRLIALEDLNKIRTCLTSYMKFCDCLDQHTPLDTLVKLFTQEAIWEGVGDKYRHTFGQLQGREEILKMFQSYVSGSTHFSMNAHFLTSENIIVDQGGFSAQGNWLMLQTSTFYNGKSHLNSAQLSVKFIKNDDQWLISHFQTENIFSRPISHWDHQSELPVPTK